MQRIDCLATTLPLRLPPCATSITAASLGGVVIVATPVATPPGVSLALPDTIPQGVQTLSLATECGCFESLVFVDLCVAPAFIGTHTPTDTSANTPSCCTPELQPSLSMYPIVLSFEITTPDDITLVEPSPIGVTATEALTDGFTIAGLPAALAYTLMDGEGFTLETGISSASMDFALGCGTYYLQLELPVP